MGRIAGKVGRLREVRGREESSRRRARAHAAIETQLRVLKAVGPAARTLANFCSCELVVVDNIGMLPAGQNAAVIVAMDNSHRLADASLACACSRSTDDGG
jgi:tRNA C32,U32 (ribose-2'-O)-methylase TrmJ